MKRSAMIQLIISRLEDFKYFNSDTTKQAELLLESIEKAGMMPPLRIEQYEDLGGYTHWTTIEGWEDEEI